MCGIAGWVDYTKNIKNETVNTDRMSLAIAPRGPDEKGEKVTEKCILIHRRLAVIDIEGGRQPMSEGVYTIVYNGELYNTAEIRNELIGEGVAFSTGSDTEVLLKGFVKWGEKVLQRLNGIYAFAVWNSKTEELFLARDRIGVKPLFFYEYFGGFIFCSDIGGLLCHSEVKSEIDAEGVTILTMLGPARPCGNGVFRGIQELFPGEYAIFSRRGLVKHKYWSLKAAKHNEDFDETAEHIRALITDSIKRQLVSDVPLATFLSGGLDSSLISAIAAQEYANRGQRLTTFSVDYKDNRKNFVASGFQPDEDAPWIMKMSQTIGSEHRNVVIDSAELADALIPSAYARNLPGMADVDSSLYLFCREVKKDFKVAVSGECADELFGGYPWYHNASILFESGFPWSRSTAERSQLLNDKVRMKTDGEKYVNDKYEETLGQTDHVDGESKLEYRMREMFMLNFYWFMQVLLDRKDRMSMTHGLEVRVPFCDHRIAEYAYNIPWELKAYKGREKGLIRHAMKGVLPDEVLWRKKSPYPKTHNPDYMGIMLKRTQEMLSRKDCPLYEIYDKKMLGELIESEGKSFRKNWYGQLMTAPQLFAYLIQLDAWLRFYNVNIVL